MGLDHLHAPLVSIREQAAHVVALLRRGEPVNFRQLIAGVELSAAWWSRGSSRCSSCTGNSAIAFEQVEPLGELTLRWTAAHWNDDQLATLGADYDS